MEYWKSEQYVINYIISSQQFRRAVDKQEIGYRCKGIVKYNKEHIVAKVNDNDKKTMIADTSGRTKDIAWAWPEDSIRIYLTGNSIIKITSKWHGSWLQSLRFIIANTLGHNQEKLGILYTLECQ